MSTIQPQLRQFDLTMIVIGLVIGMGIFRAAPEVAIVAQVPWVFFLAWILGAVVSMIGALTFAEIGSRYPAAGGFYKIFSHCYHPSFAFMVNWITVISNAASTAGVAIMGGEYLVPLIFPKAGEVTMQLVTVGAVLVLFVFNFLGIRVGSRILNVLMIIKISLLVLIIISIFVVDTPAQPLVTPKSDFVWWQALALCFIPTFFTYGGYQQTMNFGGDVVNPRKTFPRSIFIAMMIIMVLYLAANYAYVHSIGFETLKGTKTLAADVMGLMFGDIAFKIVSVLMFFSVMAYVNVSLMSNPRVYFAMAEDKVLPPVFMKVNSKTQVQEFGLTLFCVFILITLFFTASFQEILSYVMFFDSIGFITAASAIFILRYRAKKSRNTEGSVIDQVSAKESSDPEGIFKMKGYPFLPIIFVIAYVAVSTVTLVAKPEVALWGVLLFVSGLPLFYLIRYLVKRTSKENGVRA